MPSVFNNLRLEGAGRQGSLQIAGDGAAYTCRSGRSDGKVTAVKGVKRATWTVFGKYANVVLLDGDDGVLMRLDGFTAKNKEALRTDLQSIGVKLEDLEFCSSGANRGKHFFEAQGKRFVVEQTEPETEGKEPKTKRLFDLDLSRVSQCVVPTNTRAGAVPKEVSIQFNEDRREGAAEHQLVELRLYVPPGSGRDGDEENEDESDALRIQQQITQAANLKSVTGSLLAEFAPSEGVFVLPRGRYAVEMYADFFRMHGNMYDYKIAYSDVERFILLPRTDDVHYAFIVALDRPIRQGQQRYPHLVWQLKKTEAEIMVKLTEEQITSKYGANCGLKPELSGALYQLVARVFKVLSGKKVFTTGKFRSSDGRHAVSCSVKASTGQLYPLERSLAFIHKPTLIIKFEDISAVEFERFTGYGQSSATKNFDLKISTRGDGKEHTFTSIDRNEYKGLLEFLTAKGLKIRNLVETAAAENEARKRAMGLDGSSSDDDMPQRGPADSNDEDSPDEDFVAPKDASDDDDDDDDDDEDGSGSDEEEEKPKKKKKKAKSPSPEKKKKKKKRKADEDEPKKPAKKAKKKKDPNAPKGKSSAFIFFGSATRAEIKAAHPDWSLGDVGRELGKRWKELTEDDKKPYHDLAAKDAERYKTEMEAYKAKQAADEE